MQICTGIPVPQEQESLQNNPVTAAKNRNSSDPLQNHVPVNSLTAKGGHDRQLFDKLL